MFLVFNLSQDFKILRAEIPVQNWRKNGKNGENGKKLWKMVKNCKMVKNGEKWWKWWKMIFQPLTSISTMHTSLSDIVTYWAVLGQLKMRKWQYIWKSKSHLWFPSLLPFEVFGAFKLWSIYLYIYISTAIDRTWTFMIYRSQKKNMEKLGLSLFS